MPLKFIGRKKRENWDREADRELQRREKAAGKLRLQRRENANVPKNLNGVAK